MLNKTCASALGIILCFMLLAQSPVIAGTNLIASSTSNLKVCGNAYYNGYSYVFYQQGTAAYYKYSSDGGTTWSNAYSLGFSSDFVVAQNGNIIVITWWVDGTHMYLINGTISSGAISFSSPIYITHPRSINKIARTIAFNPTDKNIIYMTHGYDSYPTWYLSFTKVNISAGVETELMYQAVGPTKYFYTTILGNYCIIYWAESNTAKIWIRAFNIQSLQWSETNVIPPVNLGGGSPYGGSTIKIGNDMYGVIVGNTENKAVLVKFTLTDTGISTSCPGAVDDTISTFTNFNFAQIGSAAIGVGGTSSNVIYRYDFDVETRTFVNRTQVAEGVVGNEIRGYAIRLNNTNLGVTFTMYEDTYYNFYVDTYEVVVPSENGFASINITINTWSSFSSINITINSWSSFANINLKITTPNYFTSLTFLINTNFNAFSLFNMTISTKIAPFGTITAYIVANGTYQPPGPPGPGEQPGGGGGIIDLPYSFSANYIALALLLLIPTVVIKEQVGSFATIPTLTVMWIISFFAQLISLGLFVIGLVILIAFMFRRRMQGEVGT